MKKISLIFFLVGFAIYSNGQQQTVEVMEDDNSNKIEIDFFNNTADTSENGLVLIISDTAQTLDYFPYQGKSKSFDISKSTQEIKRLKELFTIDFVENINKCCKLKNCPNSVRHGYSFFIRKDDKTATAGLDIKFIGTDKCGNKQLTEIIDILNKLFKNYR